eukprot:TRINITY_DN16023_c0_g1_i11.p2 TRINITY_DN16023_c0_g1~~TRINITY_DN16023_c0_g1_i11.p2  ORF type:complete len:114 (+),score=5.12 TRINITY_DN16023_c0_g1_i11:493-834(+)
MIRTLGNKKKSKSDWFDKECAQKRRTVKRCLKRFQRSKKHNQEYGNEYVEERKQYKQLLSLKKREFDNERISKLKQSINNPKAFWSTIRSVNRKTVIHNDISRDVILFPCTLR